MQSVGEKRKRTAAGDAHWQDIDANTVNERERTPQKTRKLDSNLANDLNEDQDLLALLDLTTTPSTSDISDRFSQIAKLLQHEYRLYLTCVNNDNDRNNKLSGHDDGDGDIEETRTTEVQEYIFEILELEFYFHTSGHEDPYTHRADEQRRTGQWYFHRAPRSSTSTPKAAAVTAAGGYRGGTRKGLDLTFGAPFSTCTVITSPYFPSVPAKSANPPTITSTNSESTTIGGILIRSLRRLDTQEIVSGPSTLVSTLLTLSSSASIADLVNNKWGRDICAFPCLSSHRRTSSHSRPKVSLYLKRRASCSENDNDKPTIYRSARIGLDLSQCPSTTPVNREHPRIIYINKPYRYFTCPHLLTSNGRFQTLLGLYHERHNHTSNSDQAQLHKELAKLTGMKLQIVEKYLSYYREGLERGRLEDFCGGKGKGAGASAERWLRMMGCLDRVTNNASPTKRVI